MKKFVIAATAALLFTSVQFVAPAAMADSSGNTGKGRAPGGETVQAVFTELEKAPAAENITCGEVQALSPAAMIIIMMSAGSYVSGLNNYEYSDENLQQTTEDVIHACNNDSGAKLVTVMDTLLTE